MEAPDFGHTLDVNTIKKGLTSLNPSLHFDMGGKLDLHHPKIEQWEGIFYNGRHLCSLDRGPVIPEYNVYRLVEYSGEKRRGEVIRIGWRHTLERLVRKRIPNVTWANLCALFGVDYKLFRGEQIELEV